MRKLIPTVLIALVATIGFSACAMSDSVITGKIKAKLASDEVARTASFEVVTSDGEVTITGNVDSQEAKDRAVQLARETSGVTNVVDMISVRTAATLGDAPDPDRTAGEHIDDAAITARVKSRLLEDPQVKGLDIDVDTRAGVVFLTGLVRSKQEKEAAIQLALSTEGVRSVQANLSVTTI